MSFPCGQRALQAGRAFGTQLEKPALMASDAIQRALALLDVQIANSELLLSVAPIRLVSIGGSLAVCLTRNRIATYDIDCVLEPNLEAHSDYVKEFDAAVLKTAKRGDLWKGWLDRQLESFVSRERRNDLFLESIAQGITIYAGANLVVYAGRLSWALERKIRRVSHCRDRQRDKAIEVADAAALVHHMVHMQGGSPLSFAYVRGLNYNGFDVSPTELALVGVAQYYAATYGDIGLADMIWDDRRRCYRYKGVTGDWEWTSSQK